MEISEKIKEAEDKADKLYDSLINNFEGTENFICIHAASMMINTFIAQLPNKEQQQTAINCLHSDLEDLSHELECDVSLNTDINLN